MYWLWSWIQVISTWILCYHLLINHMLWNITDSNKIVCLLYFSIYSSNSALKRHYESVHLRIKKAQCPYCPVRMSQRHNLRNHINAIHLNNKRHQCKICQFSCWKKPDFERHMQKHEEVRYNCIIQSIQIL